MRSIALTGALLLACSPAFAQYHPRPVVVVRAAPRPIVVYAPPRPVETPILSLGAGCVRVLGFPLVCAR